MPRLRLRASTAQSAFLRDQFHANDSFARKSAGRAHEARLESPSPAETSPTPVPGFETCSAAGIIGPIASVRSAIWKYNKLEYNSDYHRLGSAA